MRRTITLLLACAVTSLLLAVPASRRPVLRTADDGTEKTVYLHGDAAFHYLTDSEGQWLDEQTLLPMTDEARLARIDEGIARQQARRVQRQKQGIGELNLAPRGLIILVNFSDLSFVTSPDTMRNMLNGEDFHRSYSYTEKYTDLLGRQRTRTHNISASGSARQYFHDQSWGQYNPQFDVVGPYTLSKTQSYYGGSSSGYSYEVGVMIKEACQAADNDGVDFSLYDNDHDNRVDFVYVIYAGYGRADSPEANTIWPHNYDLSAWGISCKVDGKYIRNYACSNELSYTAKTYAGVGTFTHEFGHVLGLPDFYETNESPLGLNTLNEWDIMDYGPYNNDGNTPPAYSAYERFFMGWLTPRVLTHPESVWLGPLNSDQQALLMCEGNQHNMDALHPSPSTFYLLENRKQTDWDTYLPGAGLLITKIKFSEYLWATNSVNNDSTNMGVDIIEAKANRSRYGRATDAYPAGATAYTGFANHEITDIVLESTGAITFSYRGAEKTAIDKVEDGQAARKVLRNGHIIIVRNGTEYDILGR